MRPERLQVEGFAPFRDPTEVDFSGVDLFALVGSTGAGKSSVIDALCFALYGIVPRYGHKGVVAPVITQGAVEARVLLDFAVGDEHWRAVRVVRRRGAATAATTKEARLERLPVAGADEGEVVAGTADELTAEVTRLLGLGYEHFTTCVVLPQGEFARFLHDKPAERQGLLVELLGLGLYEQMASAARVRAQAARAKAEVLDDQLADLGDLTEATRAELVAALDLATALLARIDEAEPRRLDLAEAEDVATAEADAAEQRAAALVAVVVPEGVADIGERRRRAEDEADLARSAEEQAAAAVAVAEAGVAAAGSRADLEARARDLDERARQADRIATGTDKLAAAVVEADAAEAALGSAVAAHAEAAAALEAARTADRARELAAALVVGEPCPVCGQDVLVAPEHQVADLRFLAGAVDQAERVRHDAAEAASAARRTADRYQDLLDQIRDAVADLDARLADGPMAAEVDAALAGIEAAERDLVDARAADAAARKAARAADAAVRAAETAERDARGAFDAARDALAPLGAPVPGRVDLAADWEALAAWAVAEQPVAVAAASEARATARAARDERTALERALQDEVAAAGIDAAGGPLRDAVVREIAEREADVRSIDENLRFKAEREAELAGLRTDEQVAAALGRHLDAAHFRRWVVDEALQRLVEGATGLLQTLSEGAYSLTIDDKAAFCVVDHRNADAVRSVRTLSGGETFLTSLALALALADQIAQLAATGDVRLESVFLDEGFGTLDADTLDTVADALEELGATGRLVGVVTHVRELAERMPVRFEVTKVGATSLVTRAEA
ncbi:MAG: SMC family ATPase [Acidimicrobiales bacterium]